MIFTGISRVFSTVNEEQYDMAFDKLLAMYPKYIENDKFLIITGNAMPLFGKYIETDTDKKDALGIFDYYASYTGKNKFRLS